MQLETDILKLIEKSLPAMQVEVLKGELKRAEDYSRLLARIEDRDKTIKERDLIISELRSKLSKEEDLKQREDKLAIAAEQLRVEKSEFDKNMALERCQHLQQSLHTVIDLTKTVFRNQEIVLNKSTSSWGHHKDSYGNPITATSTETTSKEIK